MNMVFNKILIQITVFHLLLHKHDSFTNYLAKYLLENLNLLPEK